MADEKKKERAAAKGKFTRKVKSVNNSITNKLTQDTVQSRFQELLQAWNELQEKHENYVIAADNVEDDDTYLDNPMEEFELAECAQLQYIRSLVEEEAADQVNNRKQERLNSILNMEAQIDSKKHKFVESCEAINQLTHNTDNPEHSVEAINEAVSRMQTSRTEIEKIQEEMIVLIIEEGKSITDLKHTAWITESEKQFNELTNAARIFSSKHSSSSNKNNITETKSSGIRALKLNFDIFSGDIRKYPCFKKDFLKHIKHRYSPNEEAIALKSYLSSEIKEDVCSLGDDAAKIWEHLDSKYGDPGKLVDSIMADVKNISKCSDDSPNEILSMINTIERAERDLRALDMQQEISNSTIVSLIEQTLPKSIENDWLDVVTGNEEEADAIRKNKFPELLKVLQKHKKKIEYKMSDIRNTDMLSGGVHNAFGTVKRSTCWIHPESYHQIWKCNTFERKPIEEKLELIRSKKACHKCLDTTHETNSCPRNFKCRKNNCGGDHHTLIHEAVEKGLTFHGTKSESKNQALLLLQSISVEHGGQIRKRTMINCLWDSGSTLSFITFSMARKLKLKGTTTYLSVTKLGGVVEQVFSQKYQIQLIRSNGELDSVTVYALEVISSRIRTVQLGNVLSLFRYNITGNALNRPTGGEVDCLLGLNVAGIHPIQKESIHHLVLYESNYGLVIGGTHPDLQESTSKSFISASVNHAFTRFEDIENIGVECNPRCGSCRCGRCHPGGLNITLQEEVEYKAVEEGLTFDDKRKRWLAKYPCVRDLKELPDNREAVLRNFLSLERRLNRDPSLFQIYQAQIDDMKERKVCRQLTKEEIEEYQGPIYYISHHLVSKKESKSTPHRLVFNTSAQFKGHILNDYYAKGPSLLNDMLGLLLRFCQHQVAICGDISKMYHSIDIPLVDQMTHLFLWRENKWDNEPRTYAMTTVNFGDRPSGCIAVVALQKTADMSAEEHPEASQIIKKNSYMDDILNSSESSEKAQEIKEAITEVLFKGGFKIKEWITSGNKNSYSIGKSIEERVLGMLWDSISDVFRFRLKPARPISMKLTKRICVSQTHGIFDPRGLLAAFTIRAKIMIQLLWALGKKLDWDDEIPSDLARDWMQFFSEIPLLNNVSFVRCLKPENAIGFPTLVLFSDGSEKAYGVCAYIRWNIGNGKFVASLIASKTKVAPLKTVSIVRLELCAAVLSKRLRVFIESEMDYEFEKVIHIVDSEIVKAMINKKSHQFHTYSANRIGEIQNATEVEEWCRVPGELNIADLVTRGVHPDQLSGKWQTGPGFLQKPISEWQIEQNNSSINLPDLRQGNNDVHLAAANEQETILTRFDITRFSKHQLLMNSTARVLSLYKRFGNTDERQSGDSTLNPQDLEEAETMWIKEAQKDLFTPLKEGKLIKLVPQIKNGIIVVGGRVKQNIISTWNNQEFILLPYAHRLSYLISVHMHRKSGHLGISATTAFIRSRFWIINLQRLVKRICFQCVLCRIKNKITAGQIMADLPLQRLQPSPPFYITGLDFIGPFIIKGEVNKRSRGKCYGVIFTCFTTRAIHLDVTFDYSTDAFLQTLRRFAAVRGWPKELHSDNGSQLVAASKELVDVVTNLKHDEIHSVCLVGGCNWKFSPADAPWHNGVTESLVKTVKRSIHTVIGEQVLTFSELQTVFYEVFQLVNQRPIGRKPTQPDEGVYLSPNDMLLGRSSADVPQGPFKERCSNKYRLDFIQCLVQQFWKRWIHDVFPNLVIQPKWHVDKRNVEINDIVLIQDINALRGKYKMGIITEVYPNSDGKVRRVQVSYKNNTNDSDYKGTKFTRVERPVQRLIVIAPHSNEQSNK